jgi:hypothetical protein
LTVPEPLPSVPETALALLPGFKDELSLKTGKHLGGSFVLLITVVPQRLSSGAFSTLSIGRAYLDGLAVQTL